MRRPFLTVCLSVVSACGFLVAGTAPVSASTNPTTVTLPVVPAAAGRTSVMTATVAPTSSGTAQITGTITFDSNGVPITSDSGPGCVDVTVSPVGSGPDAQAQCIISWPSPPATYSITAIYSGDTNWGPATSAPTDEVVKEPATVQASAPASASVNQSVQLTATVTGSFGTPTGSVAFENAQGATLCTVTLSGGTGHCTTSFGSGGSQTVTADYQGDSTYSDSTGSQSFGTATIDVAKPATATSLAAQQVPLSFQSVPTLAAYAMNFTATVSTGGTTALGGSVAFSKNGQVIPGCGSEAISGVSPQSVTCSDTNPEDFGGPVVATYTNDPHYADSASSAVSPSFTPDATAIVSVTSSPPSPVEGQSVTLNAQVSAYTDPSLGPVGFVAFTSDGRFLCFAPVDSSLVATCQTSGFATGTSNVSAFYTDPAGGYAPSEAGPYTVTVGPTLYGAVGIASTPDGGGYWIVRSDGAVSAFGDAVDYGSMFGQALNKPIVGIAATHDGGGYWLVASDGGIFSFGDAPFYGSTGSITLNKPIVGMTATPDGKGYYFVASDGGVFSYGDARFQGSMGATPLNQPVVGMATDGATGGYWLVAADGGIFSFDAPFLGSTGNIRLDQPIVGMEAAPDGSGYRFVASDGGVFCYGLPFEGSMGGITLNQPVVGMAPDGTDGYWLVARDGGLFNFDAPFLGAATG